MRAFVAVEISEEVRNRLAEVRDRLSAVDRSSRWADPGNVHITVLFLGELPEASLPIVRDILDRAAAAQPCFSCVLQGIGFFGPARAPRILWAGVQGSLDPLLRFRDEAARELQAAGIGFDDKPFVPHVTIARVKSSQNAAALAARLERFKDLSFGPIEVSRVVLMQSVLGRQGSVYSVLHVSPLGAA